MARSTSRVLPVALRGSAAIATPPAGPEAAGDQGCGLRLTPAGNLVFELQPAAPMLEPEAARRLGHAFGRGSGVGLLQLGGAELDTGLPPVFAWWRAFAQRFVEGLCLGPAAPTSRPTGAAGPVLPPPPEAAILERLVLAGPLMPGAEYLTPAALQGLWRQLAIAAKVGIEAADGDRERFLHGLHPSWNQVGRVCFNLAENRDDPDAPFAFMATYTTTPSSRGQAGQAKPRHLPLGRALQDYAGAANRQRLLSLLVPIERAAPRCAWLGPLIESGEIYHPLRWTPEEAWALLGSVHDLEQAGIIVRMPTAWRAGRPARPQVSATIGTRAPGELGLDGLLDFTVETVLDGQKLSQAEIEALLAGKDGLVLLRGQWVEVDRAQLEETLDGLKAAAARAKAEGLSLASALRLLSGATIAGDVPTAATTDWASVTAGPWLAETLATLRAPERLAAADPGPALKATLRPYQAAGVRWLHLLTELRLGACLADDMGLGKTIQVLALLLVQRRGRKRRSLPPSLLVAPASLLANWLAEAQRFAPSLEIRLVHGSALSPKAAKALKRADLHGADLVITSYGSVAKVPALAAIRWHRLFLDEAQAIKNPAARQTKAVKGLQAEARVALTGTPVENQLGDLWSIFEVINQGLLGTAGQFARYAKELGRRPENPFGPLRELVRPYILRRMKTDRSIIADLPDKTEVHAWCGLSRLQAALYAQAVDELERELEVASGMRRRGVVLAALARLKQICNHPAQWLGEADWPEADSGKLGRLREIAEVVAARQEKMLVFSQFRQATQPLADFLGQVFGRPGLVLHGGTAVKQRQNLVDRFQNDESLPFFVLSLKAGGTGLTLTAASHVVHFDRWWNPAVENQATDRAFRIGQARNILVHKLVCRGTLEERIDRMLAGKGELAEAILAEAAEIDLTSMSDAALLQLVRLDLAALAGD